MNKKSALVLANLSVGYQAGNPLITEINAKAQKGDLIALMGLNGTGKSTLFKTILKEIPSLGGTISLESNQLSLHQNMSVVFTERVSIFGFTVSEMIAQGRAPHTSIFGKLSPKDKACIQAQIDALKLNDIAHSQVNSLSDGQFQKVMIARALAQETPIILLDEPAAFLDIKNKKMIHKLLHELAQNQDKTIIVSTHDIQFCANYCSKAWVIKDRLLVEMEPQEVTESYFD